MAEVLLGVQKGVDEDFDVVLAEFCHPGVPSGILHARSLKSQQARPGVQQGCSIFVNGSGLATTY